jgi:hypothetical protein
MGCLAGDVSLAELINKYHESFKPVSQGKSDVVWPQTCPTAQLGYAKIALALLLRVNFFKNHWRGVYNKCPPQSLEN